ncbi:hypothetical protein [Cupriavidus sp. D39]|uniref:LpxL/LpxP family acyltransferase n=1 Tax=Cupriavidus sp. D39 TaxID=2997877 RepID=UPI00226D9950|nr:hypothetical protein [Cupriavidus sp. D39]MCY0858655.1 hypothetical protein [Cupriavidus sp. D39]
MLRWAFALATWLPDTASTLRVAAHMQDRLSLGADDALMRARKHAAMFRVCRLLPHLYASMPDDAVQQIVARYQFDIRGAQSGSAPSCGELVAFMHTWDYWYGVMALMIRAGRARAGCVVRLQRDANDLAVAQRMERAGFSLIFVDGNSHSALRQVVRTLRGGGIVFLFSDFYPHSDRAISVHWFGQCGRLPSGLIDIAALANVPVSIAETHIDDVYREWIQLTPAFSDVPQPSQLAMQQLATMFEQRIRTSPEQWRCWEHFETYFYRPASQIQREVVRLMRKRSEERA